MTKFFTISIIFFLVPLTAAPQNHNLMPVPSNLVWGDQRFQLDNKFHVVMNDSAVSRAGKAVERFLRRLDNKTQLLISKSFFLKSGEVEGPHLIINYQRKGELKQGEDESYMLTVTGDVLQLSAVTDLGVLHGLETFLQLIQADTKGYYIQGVTINDTPRFTWRGLLIDVARHFSPIDVIKRNIDGMSMVKMNVLHLHLSEDQGFRIESKVYPKLHLLGSNGDFFTQQQIREIIAYAADRGIRVVPEFDMPGHATSWFVGYPELASAPGPYTIEKKFGVFDPTIDPTRKSTYKFLNKFLSEMCSLFPDEYFHIGGDENNGKQWDKNNEIQKFMQKHELKDNHALQNYFNTQVLAILKKNGKKMIGWDEILQPGLPTDAMIQSWRGKEGLQDAATKGYQVILSNGYYIDLVQPAWQHYLNDPLQPDLKLAPQQQALVLGGEATMWAELVTPETIDSRIWPRTAAIAERLWSPGEVNDVNEMYRRLAFTSIQLEEAGLMHIRNQDMMLRRIAPGSDISSLKFLVSLVEPLKVYQRQKQGVAYSTDLPFTRLPDIAFPESYASRDFKMLCEQFVKGRDTSMVMQLKSFLTLCRDNHEEILKIASANPALADWIRISAKLRDIAILGIESIDKKLNKVSIQDQWVLEGHTLLTDASKPIQECELKIVEPVLMIFQHALPK